MTDGLEKDLGLMLQACVDLGLADERLRGVLAREPDTRLINVGLADVVMAEVRTLGHRDRCPRPHDWENLLPLLAEGEELQWIVCKEGGAFRVCLAFRPNKPVLDHKLVVRERIDSFNAIANAFSRRAFPETRLRWLTNEETTRITTALHDAARASITLVTGHPSPKTLDPEALVEQRDPNVRAFASLNDAVEPFFDDPNFAVVFTICRASTAEVAEELDLLTRVKDLLHPQIREQQQTSGSRSIGAHEDSSASQNTSESQQEKRNIVASLVQTLTGADKAHGRFPGRRAAASYQTSEGHTTTTGTNWNVQRGSSIGVEQLNSFLELVDKSLDERIRHLAQAAGTSGFFGSVAVYAQDEARGLRVGRAISAALAGPQTWVRPFQVIPYGGHVADALVRRVIATKDALPERRVVLSTAQACQLLLLPEAELPGLCLKQTVFYGRASDRSSDVRTRVNVGESAFHAVSVDESPRSFGARERNAGEVGLPSEALFGHVLVTGTTGSGKTLRAIHILNRLVDDDLRVLVIETAKKTYRKKLRRGGRSPRLFTLGGASHRFRINPFYFEPGASLKRHISILSDALADLLPVEALIGPKLREAILDCYSECGWNVETGTFDRAGGAVYPTMIDFAHHVASVASHLRYSTEINQNYQGALLGRAKLFVDDLYQDVFSYDGNRPLDELYGDATDVILELDELPPSEIQMPSFVVSVLLERLRAHAVLTRQRWLVVIEEAHNILHRRREQATSQRDAGVGRHLLDQVVRVLQEGRELGVGVFIIDQSPQTLADAVLKNTNTKIVHRLVDGEELRVVGESIGLDKEEWHDIGRLENGECIVKTTGAGLPVKLAPLPEHALPLDQDVAVTVEKAPPYASCARILGELADVGEIGRVFATASELTHLCKNDLQLINYVVGKHLTWRDLFPETVWRPAATLDEVPRLVLSVLVPQPTSSDLLDAVIGNSLSDRGAHLPNRLRLDVDGIRSTVDGFVRDLAASAEAISGDTEGIETVKRTLNALIADATPRCHDEFLIAVQGLREAVTLTRFLRRVRRTNARGRERWTNTAAVVADLGSRPSAALLAAAHDLLTKEVGP